MPGVERKSSLELRRNTPASLRLLSGNGSSDRVAAHIVESNGKNVSIRSAQAVPVGSAVSLDVEGGLVLAEVQFCSALAPQEYAVQLSIDQVIPSLSDVARLMDAIMAASSTGSADTGGAGAERRAVENRRAPRRS